MSLLEPFAQLYPPERYNLLVGMLDILQEVYEDYDTGQILSILGEWTALELDNTAAELLLVGLLIDDSKAVLDRHGISLSPTASIPSIHALLSLIRGLPQLEDREDILDLLRADDLVLSVATLASKASPYPVRAELIMLDIERVESYFVEAVESLWGETVDSNESLPRGLMLYQHKYPNSAISKASREGDIYLGGSLSNYLNIFSQELIPTTDVNTLAINLLGILLLSNPPPTQLETELEDLLSIHLNPQEQISALISLDGIIRELKDVSNT